MQSEVGTPRTMGMPAATTIAIMVRCPDINAIVYVTNAMFATYLDTLLTTAPTVLASLRIDHYAPITLGDAERVRYAVERVGRTSIQMAYTICADGTDCANATTVQVVINAESGAAAPVPHRWRERLLRDGDGPDGI